MKRLQLGCLLLVSAPAGAATAQHGQLPRAANQLVHTSFSTPPPPPPGLLRVISWTLNGLDVCTQNAVVRTSEDGQAHNTFWLTKRGTGGLD